MWQLQKQGLIEHQVVMINSAGGDDRTVSSILKFGSWDESALKIGEQLQILKTENVNEWTLAAD